MSRRVLVYNFEKALLPERVDGMATFELELPTGAEILHIERQPCKRRVGLWVLVDPAETGRTKRRFVKAVTGQHIRLTSALFHVGTLQYDGGASVLHIFEVADFTLEPGVAEATEAALAKEFGTAEEPAA